MSRLADGDIASALAATALFSGLDNTALGRISAACVQRGFTRGQFVCYQGDPGDRLFIVAQGLVKVVLTSEHGEEVVLTTLGASESFGEVAILDGGPRSTSVVAAESTVVLMLARSTLLEAMGEHRAVLEAMLRSLGGLIRRLTEQAGDLVFLDLGGRVAKLLLYLQDRGINTPGGLPDLRLSQSDIASMVGATRPAVNRTLQLLAARGWIEVDGQTIVILDPGALRRRAGG